MTPQRDPDDLYRALLPKEQGEAVKHPAGPAPAVIAAVDPFSPAASAGLQPRDSVVMANGVVLRDIIDWRWYADDAAVDLAVRDPLGHDREVVLGRVRWARAGASSSSTSSSTA